MSTLGRTPQSARKKAVSLTAKYPNRLQLYSTPPQLELSIEEFETFALDRLQVLKTIEMCKVRNKKDEELKRLVNEAQEKHLPLHFNTAAQHNLDQERLKDHISHFILRLAYCRTEEQRRWFLAHECALFRMRLEEDSITDFVNQNNLNYTPIPESEKNQLRDVLAAASGIKIIDRENFFKVPFEDVLDLVAQRRIFVMGGHAYVPSQELVTLITHVFRARLSHTLVLTAKSLPSLEEDERLVPILSNIGKQNVGSDYKVRTSAAGEVTADSVDTLVEHFPLCMRHLHEELQANHHLKHDGREQYGAFLKGLGLTMQEALIFWRRAFAPKISEDKFNKSYAYNIRYLYGQEGRRVDVSPFSCMKIIMGKQPGPGQSHGCPFRHFSAENLRAKLRSYNVSEGHIAEILQLVQNQHYQIACTRYFEVTHKSDVQVETITHPNGYVDLSLGRKADHRASSSSTQPHPDQPGPADS